MSAIHYLLDANTKGGAPLNGNDPAVLRDRTDARFRARTTSDTLEL